MLTLHLPWPPSLNHYWRSAAAGRAVRVYVSDEGKAYRTAVQRAAAAWRARGGRQEPLRGRLAVRVALFAPTRTEYDIDNRLKGLLDALTAAGVWLDDKQVDRLEVERGEVVRGGACTVAILAIEARAAA